MLPWINTTPVDQRRALSAARTAGDAPVAELARLFRVSRKTAYKFINRYNQLATPASTTSPALPTTPAQPAEQRGDQVGWGASVPQRVVGRGAC